MQQVAATAPNTTSVSGGGGIRPPQINRPPSISNVSTIKHFFFRVKCVNNLHLFATNERHIYLKL